MEKLKKFNPDNEQVTFKEHTELYVEVKSWHECTNGRLEILGNEVKDLKQEVKDFKQEVKDFKQEVNNRFDKIDNKFNKLDTDLQIIKNLLLQKNNGLKAVK